MNINKSIESNKYCSGVREKNFELFKVSQLRGLQYFENYGKLKNVLIEFTFEMYSTKFFQKGTFLSKFIEKQKLCYSKRISKDL